MTRNDFIIQSILAMLGNSKSHYTWHGRDQWAENLIDAAFFLTEKMSSRNIKFDEDINVQDKPP